MQAAIFTLADGSAVIGGAVALGALVPGVRARLALSRAKYRSLAGHARLSRRVAGLIPYYAFGEDRFFDCDGAPAEIAARRRQGFFQLAGRFGAAFTRSNALTAQAKDSVSDLQFTAAYRVPFPFSEMVQRHLPVGSFLARSSGVTVTDLDGNVFIDLTGSYGVNLFGHDFYKACIDRGAARVRDLGPVLGSYHPVVADNVARLRAVSGLDEISFHMSGTEAVMQAVRLARYHTGRTHLVRFCGAYHGWWGDVQPGIGNPTPVAQTYTLAELSGRTLEVLRRRRDIACVLVNPLQALHPNAGAPSDGTLVDSGRRAGADRAAYAAWLGRLRQVCDARGIVLIFDEVFVGFRLARRGAAEYFGVQPDMVTYGKSLGGGLPVGVLCGRAALMKRFRDDRPVDICFARGTFNSHPYVMGAMAVFLNHLETAEAGAVYASLDRVWEDRAALLNRRLEAAGLPVRVAGLSSIWTVMFMVPSRYNWMLQYYLRDAGIALSWVGTGRLIFSLDFTDADFEAVCGRLMQACGRMQADGWWWNDGNTNRSLRRRVLRETANALLAKVFWVFSPEKNIVPKSDA
jgi:glutamate-1-semialdehyde 2,1-aminomutase